MDVDGTMTVNPGNIILNRSPRVLLEDLLMEKEGCSRKEAWGKVVACGDIETHCLTEFFPALGVDPRRFFDLLLADLKTTTVIPDDTKRFFRFLKEKNIPLYTATTNSKFITLAKLAVGGLADYNGCEYITGYFPGCFFRDPEGKYSKNYYKRILESGRFDPEQTMMIGDEPLRDSIPARKSGIRYGINIDRNQDAAVVLRDGIYFINSCDVLISALERGMFPF